MMTDYRPLDPERLESRSRLPWRILRWASQSIALLAIVFGPFLGAWQRLDRAYLSAWNSENWELPTNLAAHLPHDESTKIVYEINSIIGGGSAANYLSLPIADPIGSLVAWFTDPLSPPLTAFAWLAFLGPVLLGILGGRIFCGWLCPFGSLSRLIEGLLERLSWKAPRYVLPKQRHLRFVLLGLCVVVGVLGSHFVFYASLPYILMQQSIYSMWILGGGGAVFGAFLGLLVAGLLFGPSTYCATLCPTGALLNALGRKKAIRLRIVDSDDCGAHCDLCDRGCWLALQPSLGDPGPDCDSCGRCIEVCPSNNLRFFSSRSKSAKTIRRGSENLVSLGQNTPTQAHSKTPTFSTKVIKSLAFHHRFRREWIIPLLLSLFLTGACAGATPSPSEQNNIYDIGPSRPKLVFEQFLQLKDDKSVGISVVDSRHVQLDADDQSTVGHTEISLYLAKAREKQLDEHGGILAGTEVYVDEIRVDLFSASSLCPKFLELKRPNSPISTPNRSVYRTAIPCNLVPGDLIRLKTISSTWLSDPIEWKIPYVSPGDDWVSMPLYFAIGFFFYAGLHALAIGQRDPKSGTG